jgi:DNA-binding HxlR family transcriptional regulator
MASMAPDALSRLKRRYQHFCPAARALETIGEKWSLLIVRDLLGGPRRFSDLRRSLGTITPKGLSARLRALEADGIVTREVAGEREVWYRLTPKGQALESVFDALLVWGGIMGWDPRAGGKRFIPGARWTRQRGEAAADVIVQTSPDEWVKGLSADVEGRRRWLRQQRAAGTRQRLDELMTSVGVGQQTLRSREPGGQRAAMAKN